MPRNQPLLVAVAVASIVLLAGMLLRSPFANAGVNSSTPPEFTHSDAQSWLNSKPITLASLKGQVVLIDFWTFECWNCYRSFPWLNTVYDEFHSKGLAVVGVHTPNSIIFF